MASKNRCFLKCCNNSLKSLSYHFFPKDATMKQKWIDAITNALGPLPTDLYSARVCSKHFIESDYFPTAKPKPKRLKPQSCPSVFRNTNVMVETDEHVPKQPFCRLSPEQRTEILEEMGALSFDLEELEESNGGDIKKVELQDPDPENPLPNIICLHDADELESESQRSSIASVQSSQSLSLPSSGISLKSTYTPNTPGKVQLVRKQLELLSLRAKEKFTVTRFVSNDTAIRFYTGFPSYEVFWAFYQLLLPECAKLNYVGQETNQIRDNTDKDFHEVVKPGRPRKLNPIEEFFLTLVRLRLGTQEQFLADLYNLSQGHVSRIINTWVLFLYERCLHLPVFASLERALELTSAKIKKRYPDLRIIVDCTEFKLEKPSASEAQRETFSAYKHCNTVKALVGMAGSGHLTYCSNLYCGRTSDKKLILHCGLLDMLEEGDGIMADRGFDIAKELALKKLKLYIPEFLQGRDQFTASQLSETRKIAFARIHIERAIGRVKEFKILKGEIPLTLTPMLEKIYVVCCHLSNFTGKLVQKLD